MNGHDDYEPHHSESPTAHVLHELQLYGYRPREDEPEEPDGDRPSADET